MKKAIIILASLAVAYALSGCKEQATSAPNQSADNANLKANKTTLEKGRTAEGAGATPASTE